MPERAGVQPHAILVVDARALSQRIGALLKTKGLEVARQHVLAPQPKLYCKWVMDRMAAHGYSSLLGWAQASYEP